MKAPILALKQMHNDNGIKLHMVTGHREPCAGDHSVWKQRLLEMSAEVLWANRNVLFVLPAEKWIIKQALLGSGLHLPGAFFALLLYLPFCAQEE